MSSLTILLLCNKPDIGQGANTVIDHITAFERYSSNKIYTVSMLGQLPQGLDLSRFDVLIVHYSLSLLNDYCLSSASREKIRQFSGLKVLFVQDEYRAINRMVAAIHDLNFDVLFTCFPEGEFAKIYPSEALPGLSCYTNLTGYVPERLLLKKDFIKLENRPIDVGYRARKLPFWYGELGYEKWNIVEQWKEKVRDKALKVDLSYREQDRLYGEDWTDFLSRCKATLGVESGASVMDFTGELEREVDWYQVRHPKASFAEVRELFFKDQEGKYRLNQISPRCFEAIALKTALILYEGEYSGILQPGRHYIALKKDFSNQEAVLRALRDPNRLESMVETAYQEVALDPAWHYSTWINSVDEVIYDEFCQRKKLHAKNPFTIEQDWQILNKLTYWQRFLKKIYAFYSRLPASIRLLLRNVLRWKR